MANKFFAAIRARFFNTAADTALDVGVSGDANPRLSIDAGGKISWGNGTDAVDTNIYRDSADVLKTDDTLKVPVLFIDGIEVDTTGATTDQVLKYNGTKFIPSTGSSVGSLNDLSDVVITTPLEFQTLEYNGTNWVNANAQSSVYVRNAEATTITTGTCVYLFGATGDHATVKRADHNSDATSAKTIGVVSANILASENGVVVTQGYVDGINLSVGYTAGDVLWLGEAGAFTKTKPTAPDHLVFIGVVVRATNNGIIYVATQNGYELDELHNVSLPSPQSGEFLKYNGSLWVADAIDLGTDTTGNYVGTITAGTGVTTSGASTGEGIAHSISIGQSVATSASPTFAGGVFTGSTSTDLVRITQAGTGNAFVVEDSNPDSTPFVISNTGSAVIGHTVPVLITAGVQPNLQILGNTVPTSSLMQVRYNSDTTGPNIYLGHSRSTTIGGHTTVATGDNLGNLQFVGSDGTNFISSASIVGNAEGTISTGVVPGRLTFNTANSAGTLTERMRINSAGEVGIGTANNYGKVNIAGSAAIHHATPLLNFVAASNTRLGYLYHDATNLQLLNHSASGGIQLATNSTNRFIINSAGEVGIASSPISNTRLTVTGGSTNSANPILILNGVSGSGALYFHNDMGAGSYNSIVTAGSKGIIATGPNGSTTKGALAIAPWSDTPYGIRLTGGSTTDILVRGTTTFTPTLAADKALIVQGVASQSGDFFDIQNSGGTSQFKVDSAGNLFVASNAITGDAKTKLGLGRTGNGFSYIDLIGDATYDNYGLRLLRGNTGANAASELLHRGTGNFQFTLIEAAPILFSTTNTERMRIDASGNLLLGATSRRSVGGGFQTTSVNAFFNEQGNGLTPFTSVLNRADSNGLRFVLGKSRGTTAGAVTALVANDSIAEFHFAGADGTTLDPLASRIMVHVDGVVATGSVPGRLSFATNPVAGTNPVERMRITSAGNVGIGTTSPAYKLHLVGGTGTVDNVELAIDVAGGNVGDYAGIVMRGAETNDMGAIRSYLESSYLSNMRFYTAGATNVLTERMRIDSVGRVGINGASSASMVSITNNTASNPILVVRSAALQTGNLLDIQNSSGGSLVTVNSAGAFVGPVSSIRNFGDTHFSSFQARADSSAQGLLAGYSFYPTFVGTGDNGVRRAADISAGFTGAWGTEYLSFGVGTGGANDTGAKNTERMRITGAGNVGIGTASPSTALQVNGTITATSYTGALASAVTATTQTVGDNSTKVATTAFVIANAGGSFESDQNIIANQVFG